MHPLSFVYAVVIAYVTGVVNNVARQRDFNRFGADNLFLSAGALIGIFLFDRIAEGLVVHYPGYSLWSGLAGTVVSFLMLGISYIPPIQKHLQVTVRNENEIEVDPDMTRPTIRRGDL